MPSPPAAALPENITAAAVQSLEWKGVRVETARYTCSGRVLHPMPYEDRMRLSVVLDERGGRCEPRLDAHAPSPVPYAPRHMTWMPADQPMWGYSAGIRFVHDATVCFDFGALEEDRGERLDLRALATPRLGFTDQRIWQLARLLAEACTRPEPDSPLYTDGLVTALLALLGSLPPARVSSRGLAPWQLRRALEHLDGQLPARVGLRELAAVTGLSPAHFSRAFRLSTGVAPYQWQLDARIRRAQHLLLHGSATLDEIAHATGFADAAHFAHTFRRRVGASPVAWRDSQR